MWITPHQPVCFLLAFSPSPAGKRQRGVPAPGSEPGHARRGEGEEETGGREGEGEAGGREAGASTGGSVSTILLPTAPWGAAPRHLDLAGRGVSWTGSDLGSHPHSSAPEHTERMKMASVAPPWGGMGGSGNSVLLGNSPEPRPELRSCRSGARQTGPSPGIWATGVSATHPARGERVPHPARGECPQTPHAVSASPRVPGRGSI